MDYWLIESVGAQVFNQNNKSEPNVSVPQAGETEHTILTKPLIFSYIYLFYLFPLFSFFMCFTEHSSFGPIKHLHGNI